MSSLNDVINSVKKSLSFNKEIEILGTKYGFRLLSIEEENKANSDAASNNLEGLVYFNNLKKNFLSYAINKISDCDIGDTVEVTEKDVVVKKEKSIYMKDFLGQLPTELVDELFEAYVDFKEEAESKLKLGIKYTWYKTPEQRTKEMKERVSKQKEEEAEEVKLKEISVPKEEPPQESAAQ